MMLESEIFNTLMLIFVCLFAMWYVQYHWKRRKLYRMAAQRNGPLALPVVGSALYFGTSSSDFFKNAIRLINEFESPVRLWLGQRLVFAISTPNDLETIMNSPHALTKAYVYAFADVLVGEGLFTSRDVPKWRRHRKTVMPTFNQKILDGFVEVFSKQSDILVEQLEVEAGKGIFDIYDYIGRCTLDIICETAMGMEVNAQTTDSNYMKWITKALEILILRVFRPLYYYDFIYNRTAMKRELSNVIQEINKFTSTVIQDKRTAYEKKMQENRERPEAGVIEEPTKRKYFLQLLIELTDESAKFTDEELLEEVKSFLVGGSESTATTNSFTFVVLGMFPDIQQKVYEEVIDVLGPDRRIEPRDLAKLQYLDRVLKEILRLFPIAPFIARDITADIQLENCTIPADSTTVLFIGSIHKDPNLWPNPLKFDPDRFLPEEVSKRHPYSWIPFSGGPRNCIGPRYAMMAMKSLIATVVRKYRFSTDYKSIEDLELKVDITLKAANGFRVSIEQRT